MRAALLVAAVANHRRQPAKDKHLRRVRAGASGSMSSIPPGGVRTSGIRHGVALVGGNQDRSELRALLRVVAPPVGVGVGVGVGSAAAAEVARVLQRHLHVAPHTPRPQKLLRLKRPRLRVHPAARVPHPRRADGAQVHLTLRAVGGLHDDGVAARRLDAPSDERARGRAAAAGRAAACRAARIGAETRRRGDVRAPEPEPLLLRLALGRAERSRRARDQGDGPVGDARQPCANQRDGGIERGIAGVFVHNANGEEGVFVLILAGVEELDVAV